MSNIQPIYVYILKIPNTTIVRYFILYGVNGVNTKVIPLIKDKEDDYYNKVYIYPKINRDYKISNASLDLSIYYSTIYNCTSYLNSNCFYLAQFEDLLDLIKFVNELPYWDNLKELLQLVLSKWDDWY